MKPLKTLVFVLLVLSGTTPTHAQKVSVFSPDRNIEVVFDNGARLTYSVLFKGRAIVDSSLLGFEFQGEPAMDGNFMVTGQQSNSVDETWIPVVKSKHGEVRDHYNSLQVNLKEKSGLMRRMDVTFRVYNDGVAFRCKLFRSENIGNRVITRECTTFHIPGDPNAWMVDYGGYASSQESEFFKHKLSTLTEKSVAGLPFLMEYGNNC